MHYLVPLPALVSINTSLQLKNHFFGIRSRNVCNAKLSPLPIIFISTINQNQPTCVILLTLYPLVKLTPLTTSVFHFCLSPPTSKLQILFSFLPQLFSCPWNPLLINLRSFSQLRDSHLHLTSPSPLSHSSSIQPTLFLTINSSLTLTLWTPNYFLSNSCRRQINF